MEQAQKKAEAEANRQCVRDQKAAVKEQKAVERARLKAEKDADKQRKEEESRAKQMAWKRKADELTDENTDPVAPEQEPKCPRPSRPQPHPRPNILVPTTTGGPADLPSNGHNSVQLSPIIQWWLLCRMGIQLLPKQLSVRLL